MMGRVDAEATITDVAKQKRISGKMGGSIKAAIEWQVYASALESVPRAELAKTIAANLFQTKTKWNTDVLKNYTDSSSRFNFIKTATIQLMSMPEYQMC